MSGLSPRESFSGPSSEEVAEDFKDSLGDLAFNNKFEIQNLTMIAKESTEHAQAISRVLENHIKTTPPDRKLPALYVLDSIIKNVGTPYTVYLGRNLYSTFMEMYGLVDAQTRRAMEAVLKTWKDPIAESTDRRPVLPPELVRPIENALMKAKAAQMKYVQQTQAMHTHNTATPPQTNGMYAQAYPQQQGGPFQYPVQQGRPPSQMGYQPPYQGPPAPTIDQVKRDLYTVLQAAEAEVQRRPYDPTVSGRVRALQDLNMILHTYQPSPADLQAIAAEVRDQQQRISSHPQPVMQSTVPQQWQAPQPLPYPQPQLTPQLPTQNPYAMPQQPPVSIPPSQLSSLAALFNNGPKPSTPQMRNAAPALQSLPQAQVSAIQTQAAAAPPSNGADLLAALSKAGIIRNPEQQPTISQPAAPPVPAQAGLADLLNSLNKNAAPAANGRRTTIDLTSLASLDMFRPELVRKLYPEQSERCPQCGRRFPSTVDGRKKKDMHLDWHFRVNQRAATSAMGRFRNWFTDDIEWVNRREFDESTADAAATQEASTAAVSKAKDPKQSYVRAPAGITQVTCNICYEEMRSSFPEEIGDWVFVNAAINNGKIVHATCLADVQGSGGAVQPPSTSKQTQQQTSLAAALAALGDGQREQSRTPDSSLGKRKAEDEAGGPGKLLKGSL